MRVVWLPVAIRDRRRQLLFIAERNAPAAIRLGDRLEECVAAIARYPFGGRPGRVAGTREWPLTGTPWILVYRVETDAVVVLRLLHGAQSWPPETA